MRNKVQRKRKIRTPQKYTQITLYDYLASSVPAIVFNVINKQNQYRQPQSQEELTEQIKNYVKNNGESAIIELAKIHPDKELINLNCEKCSVNDLKENIAESKNLIYSDFNGVSTNNFTGKEVMEKFRTINTNMVVLGAFILLGVAYLVKTK